MKYLFILLAAVFFATTPIITVHAQNLEDLSPATQEELKNAAAQQGISVESFIKDVIQPLPDSVNLDLLVIVGINIVIIVIGVIAGVVILKRRKSDTKKQVQDAKKFDDVRKKNLVRLYHAIKRFYLDNNLFPTESQFASFISELTEELKHDPLWKKPLPGHADLIVDYHYTQTPPTSVRSDPHYFKLHSHMADTMQVGVDTDRFKELLAREGIEDLSFAQ
ncbi:hypothetical protein KC614_00140 [candidate division WWE3 bacterium]|uniref:DUF4129 domain-containing protein n=1 Tax=candidate division WWE3 bacterium TaxID=2053526 RepID=A0A955LJW1_UNCKA|nr:hypothetical protein [candidate division WWE3 bacterium]